jgi:hypothetical protein
VLVVARLVAARAIHLGHLRARLDGDVDGLRELLDVALVGVESAVDVARLLIKVAGGEQRLALSSGSVASAATRSYSLAARELSPSWR